MNTATEMAGSWLEKCWRLVKFQCANDNHTCITVKVSLISIINVQCAVSEKIHTFPTGEILRGWVMAKVKFKKKIIELNWNFKGGGGGGCRPKNPLWGVWIFSGTTQWKQLIFNFHVLETVLLFDASINLHHYFSPMFNIVSWRQVYLHTLWWPYFSNFSLLWKSWNQSRWYSPWGKQQTFTGKAV